MGKLVVFVGFISSGKHTILKISEDPVIIFQDHLLIFPGILELYTGIISSANSIQFKFPEISSPSGPISTPRWRSTHHSPFPLALFSVLVVEGWMSFTSTTSYLTRSMLGIPRIGRFSWQMQ